MAQALLVDFEAPLPPLLDLPVFGGMEVPKKRKAFPWISVGLVVAVIMIAFVALRLVVCPHQPDGGFSSGPLVVRETLNFVFYVETVQQGDWLQQAFFCSPSEYKLRVGWKWLLEFGTMVYWLVVAGIESMSQQCAMFKPIMVIMLTGMLLAWWLRLNTLTVRVTPGLKRKLAPAVGEPESLLPGCPLLSGGKIPKGQVAVAFEQDGTLNIVGGGFRLENYLITPTHNTYTGMDVYVVTDTSEYKVDSSTGMEIAADVSAFLIPEAAWSRLGVSQVRLAPLKGPSTVTVTSSTQGEYSLSQLKPTSPMGRVAYMGSTKPGFSGSLYVNGSAALGMHCHGGVLGGGYECLYLWARLKDALDQVNESSEDFLMGVLKRDKYAYEELADKNVIVRTGDGNYHRTKKQLIEKIEELRSHGGNWALESDFYQAEEDLEQGRYDDYVPESLQQPSGSGTFPGESQRPVAKRTQVRQPLAQSSSQKVSSVLAAKPQRQPAKRAHSVPAKGRSFAAQLQRRLNTVQTSLNKRSEIMDLLIPQREQNTPPS